MFILLEIPASSVSFTRPITTVVSATLPSKSYHSYHYLNITICNLLFLTVQLNNLYETSPFSLQTLESSFRTIPYVLYTVPIWATWKPQALKPCEIVWEKNLFPTIPHSISHALRLSNSRVLFNFMRTFRGSAVSQSKF